MLTSRGDIAIAELAIYCPAFLLSVANGLFYARRGFAFAWAYITAFCLIRIVGSAMLLIIQLQGQTGLYEATMIMTTIAVAPLLDGTFSFANPSTQSTYRSRREKLAGHFYILQLIVGAGLILGIIGGISIYGSNPNKWDKARKELQAGTALFLLVWVAVVSIAITFWRDRKFMSGFQRSVYPALLAIALPCLLIRIIYSLANAVNIHTSGTQVFNPLTGSLAAYVCMSVIPEMAIVLTYEAVATYSILAKK